MKCKIKETVLIFFLVILFYPSLIQCDITYLFLSRSSNFSKKSKWSIAYLSNSKWYLGSGFGVISESIVGDFLFILGRLSVCIWIGESYFLLNFNVVLDDFFINGGFFNGKGNWTLFVID